MTFFTSTATFIKFSKNKKKMIIFFLFLFIKNNSKHNKNTKFTLKMFFCHIFNDFKNNDKVRTKIVAIRIVIN